MQRRALMSLAAGAAVAPAVAKEELRASLIAARIPTGVVRATYDVPVAVREVTQQYNGLTKLAFNQLRRAQMERDCRHHARRCAWEMALDPDIAAMSSCSEVYLRHLQEKRILKEHEEARETEWKLYGLPDYLTD